MTMSLDDQKKLNKVVSSLDVSSPGQLVRMLISGEEKRIDWICVELNFFKRDKLSEIIFKKYFKIIHVVY